MAFALLLGSGIHAAPVHAETDQCPSGGTKTEGGGSNLVLPAGTTFCVKASTGASGIITADGTKRLSDYVTWKNGGGQVPGISHYVIYSTPNNSAFNNAVPNNLNNNGDRKDNGKDNGDRNENAAAQGKITICHHTSSATNPYVEITISVNGLNGHDHHDDIIPAPAAGCPSGSVTAAAAGTLVICVPTGADLHSYVKKTIDLSKDNLQQLLNGGSIIMPAGGCPSEVTNQASNTLVTICQATGVSASPYLTISVTLSSLPAYANGTNIIPMPEGGCPTSTQFSGTINASFIAICVPSGIASAPYNQLFVPMGLIEGFVNEVNIVPAPAAGCPVASVTAFSGTGTNINTNTGSPFSNTVAGRSNEVPAAFNTVASGLPAVDTVAGRSNSVPETGGVLGSAQAVSPLPPAAGSGGFGASDEGPVGAVALGLGFIILAGAVTTARLLTRQQ